MHTPSRGKHWNASQHHRNPGWPSLPRQTGPRQHIRQHQESRAAGSDSAPNGPSLTPGREIVVSCGCDSHLWHKLLRRADASTAGRPLTSSTGSSKKPSGLSSGWGANSAPEDWNGQVAAGEAPSSLRSGSWFLAALILALSGVTWQIMRALRPTLQASSRPSAAQQTVQASLQAGSTVQRTSSVKPAASQTASLVEALAQPSSAGGGGQEAVLADLAAATVAASTQPAPSQSDKAQGSVQEAALYPSPAKLASSPDVEPASSSPSTPQVAAEDAAPDAPAAVSAVQEAAPSESPGASSDAATATAPAVPAISQAAPAEPEPPAVLTAPQAVDGDPALPAALQLSSSPPDAPSVTADSGPATAADSSAAAQLPLRPLASVVPAWLMPKLQPPPAEPPGPAPSSAPSSAPAPVSAPAPALVSTAASWEPAPLALQDKAAPSSPGSPLLKLSPGPTPPGPSTSGSLAAAAAWEAVDELPTDPSLSSCRQRTVLALRAAAAASEAAQRAAAYSAAAAAAAAKAAEAAERAAAAAGTMQVGLEAAAEHVVAEAEGRVQRATVVAREAEARAATSAALATSHQDAAQAQAAVAEKVSGLSNKARPLSGALHGLQQMLRRTLEGVPWAAGITGGDGQRGKVAPSA
ncbi:hypothetical protein QJQ45_026285 [Haematococcus lacustris]|nr:hypothetical protein QJQ45_026285 [Haematococcus lacustris]